MHYLMFRWGTSQFAGSIEENANYSGNSIIIHPPIGTADEGTMVKVKDVEAELAKLFVAVISDWKGGGC